MFYSHLIRKLNSLKLDSFHMQKIKILFDDFIVVENLHIFKKIEFLVHKFLMK